MDVFNDVNVDDIHVDMVRYRQQYLDFEKPNSTELWHKALLLCKNKPEWCGIALVIQICLCTPCSNTTMERHFNHLKVVKTDQPRSLPNRSLPPSGPHSHVHDLLTTLTLNISSYC